MTVGGLAHVLTPSVSITSTLEQRPRCGLWRCRRMVTRRLMLASGLRLVVRDYGSGVPVLLVHAWGETHRSFDRLVRLLAPHLRLVVPDQRGVGDSDKPAEARAANLPGHTADHRRLQRGDQGLRK